MKYVVFLFLFLCFSAQAKTVASFSYSKTPKRVQNISFADLQSAYTITRRSAFNPPGPKDFFNEYLRFRLAVEAALHDKALVKSPDIVRSIQSPFLRRSFEQELYKAFGELKLRGRMQALDKKSARLSKSVLRGLYRKNPEFNYFYISIQHPVGPTKAQIQEAESRARKVFASVKSSKKEFTELVTLNSDEKLLGVLPISRSRGSILPAVYKQLKKMRPGEVSAPIRTAAGFQIVKLNEKTPFDRANLTMIKADYFNERRTKMFNSYFNNLKKQFSVKMVHPELIRSLK